MEIKKKRCVILILLLLFLIGAISVGILYGVGIIGTIKIESGSTGNNGNSGSLGINLISLKNYQLVFFTLKYTYFDNLYKQSIRVKTKLV